MKQTQLYLWYALFSNFKRKMRTNQSYSFPLFSKKTLSTQLFYVSIAKPLIRKRIKEYCGEKQKQQPLCCKDTSTKAQQMYSDDVSFRTTLFECECVCVCFLTKMTIVFSQINVREYRRAKKGQSRETGNIRQTRRRKTKQKLNTICVSNHYTQTKKMDPIKNRGLNWCAREG